MTDLLTLAIALALLTPAQEGEPPSPEAGVPAAPYKTLEVSVLPGIWMARLDGMVSLGVGAPKIDLAQDFGLDDFETSPNFELTLRRNEIWDLTFSGFHFETDTAGMYPGTATYGAIAFTPGDPFVGEFEISSFAIDLAVAVWRPLSDGSARGRQMDNRTYDGRYICDLRFSPVLGMRWVDVDQVITSGGVFESSGGEWAIPYVGIDANLEYRPENPIPLLNMFRIQVGFAAGPALGGNDGFSWQVRAGMTYQVTEMFGVMVGYRALELNVENDDYKLEGGLQGLFLAASLRF